MTPDRIESAPRLGPMTRSSRYVRSAGSAPGSKRQREVVHFFRREGAVDRSLIGDPAVDARRRSHALVQDDGERAADVLSRRLPESARAGARQREADRGTIVLVERRLCAPEISTRRSRDLLQQVERGGGVAGDAGTRNDFHVGRDFAAERLEERFLARRRSSLDELQLELRRRPDDLLRMADVGHARELHENLIAGLTVAGDVRLGNTQLVDAPVDRIERLDDSLLAEILRDVRLHREVVGAGYAGLPVVVRARLRVGDPAEVRITILRHTLDVKARGRRGVDGPHRDVGRLAALRGSARPSSWSPPGSPVRSAHGGRGAHRP